MQNGAAPQTMHTERGSNFYDRESTRLMYDPMHMLCHVVLIGLS